MLTFQQLIYDTQIELICLSTFVDKFAKTSQEKSIVDRLKDIQHEDKVFKPQIFCNDKAEKVCVVVTCIKTEEQNKDFVILASEMQKLFDDVKAVKIKIQNQWGLIPVKDEHNVILFY